MFFMQTSPSMNNIWKFDCDKTCLGRWLHCIRSNKLYKISFIKAQLFENHRKCVNFKNCKRTSYVYILKVQKFIKNAKSGPFRRVLENLKLEVKQCYQICQFFRNFRNWKISGSGFDSYLNTIEHLAVLIISSGVHLRVFDSILLASDSNLNSLKN